MSVTTAMTATATPTPMRAFSGRATDEFARHASSLLLYDHPAGAVGPLVKHGPAAKEVTLFPGMHARIGMQKPHSYLPRPSRQEAQSVPVNSAQTLLGVSALERERSAKRNIDRER
jgi:hypothetical protein